MSLSQLTHVSYQTGVIARFVIPRVTWYYTIIPARLSLGGVYAGMYWGNMLTCLGLHGFILVGLVSFYVYWSDVEVAADACLVGLVLELLGVGLLTRYCLTTDCVFFLHLGSAWAQPVLPQPSLVLCFDEISGFFLSILLFALVICFFFLVEYFEYDARAGSILLLSSLFSQAAALYFCAFDVVLLLFFWELLGLVSFLLVQHWAFRLTTYNAGLKVFTFSQVGDLFFLFFVFWSIDLYETTDLAELLALISYGSFDFVLVGSWLVRVQTLLALCLYLAFSVKAAQWFFYPWLLDAMEAPVPISAQLHSSTLVVVGFYLLFRFECLFLNSPSVLHVLLVTGVCTAVGAAVLGFYQQDGKRLLASSTASQLGYVLVAYSSGLFLESLVLLTFCCCGKALTFVWFGAFMRSFSGYSDSRVAGGASVFTWVEHAGVFVSVASFTVFPGVFGWHVKALLTQGQLWTVQQAYLRVGLELLELSWFFSSLYLWALYVSFFLAPAGTRLTTLANQARSLGLSQKNLSALSVHPKLAVTVIPSQLASSLAGGLTSTTLLCVLWVACLAFISYAGLGFLVHVEGLFGGVTLGNMLSYY